jgi:hypothetical protein
MPLTTEARSRVSSTSASSRDPANIDRQLADLLRAYKAKRRPVVVSFRDMLRYPAGGSRYTHNLHHYPARLLANIPAFFLSAETLCAPCAVVLDPFCGSGTVPLEAITRGFTTLGADANPLARLVAKVKTTPIQPLRLRRALQGLRERIPDNVPDENPDVLNRDYWFHPHVWKGLARVLAAIQLTRNDEIRDFFLVTFSSCIRDVSLADPRLSVPVRLRLDQYPKQHALREATDKRIRRLRTIDVVCFFVRRAERNIQMMDSLWNCDTLGTYLGTATDARSLKLDASAQSVAARSVDVVVTSPPYVGAQKYIRASSLSMTWLGMCAPAELRAVEDANIGREHYSKESYQEYAPVDLPGADTQLRRIHRKNALRAHIAGTYLREMRQSFVEAARVLRKGGHFLLVIGEGRICGEPFDTPRYLAMLAEAADLQLRLSLVDPIRSRSLMTKRNKTAGIISSESVMLFERR